MRDVRPLLQRGHFRHAPQIVDRVSTPIVEKEVLSTLSLHVPAPQPIANMIMFPVQDAIEELVLAFVQRLEVAHMAKIQNLKVMHAQEVDVLQSQIYRLILNLQTLTPSNA